MNYIFPAIFTPVPDGGFAIHFPDLKGTNSQGLTLEEALLNATDALENWIDYLLDEKENIPVPSSPNDIELEGDQFATLIHADLERFRRLKSNKSIKKTLTIPEWMDEKATELGINFSRVLQDALQNKFDESA